MTLDTFIYECLSRCVPVSLAMEHDTIREALAADDDARVLKLLDEEF